MEAIAVLFFLVVTRPGEEPLTHHHATADLAECLAEVRDVLERVSPNVSAVADTVQAGCVVRLPQRS
jgi:hypothetical protein